ncbi:MAG: AI-2E family transporter [Lachnospiraceae bacterium]|nr:AI-2E family transporter [Lachnospiraceae bacterium]
MEKSGFLQERYVRLYKIIGVTAGVYLTFRYALPLFAPFVAAYLLAGIVRPAALFLKRKVRIPVGVGGAVLLLFLLAALGSGVWFLGKLLVKQIVLFTENYAGYRASFFSAAEKFCRCADGWFSLKQGTMDGLFQAGISQIGKNMNEKMLPEMSKQSIVVLRALVCGAAGVVIAFVAAVLLLTDREKYAKGYRNSGFYKEARQVLGRLSAAGAAYLKTQCILISLVALICSVGFLFVKREYAFLLGIGVAMLDALPVIGSGIVLVPWTLVCLVKGDYIQMAVLILMYLCCVFVREGLEPKLLGSRIGIPPLYTLMAVYIGVELFGILGVVLGPFGLVIIRSIL